MSADKAAKLAYFTALEKRMLRLLQPFEDNLSKEDADFVAELIDVHELGLGLEVLSNMLLENKVPLDQPTIDEIESLVGTMGLSTAIVDQLRGQVGPRAS
jgi:hypothetical protein